VDRGRLQEAPPSSLVASVLRCGKMGRRSRPMISLDGGVAFVVFWRDSMAVQILGED
jgi:hypothetical protein